MKTTTIIAALFFAFVVQGQNLKNFEYPMKDAKIKKIFNSMSYEDIDSMIGKIEKFENYQVYIPDYNCYNKAMYQINAFANLLYAVEMFHPQLLPTFINKNIGYENFDLGIVSFVRNTPGISKSLIGNISKEVMTAIIYHLEGDDKNTFVNYYYSIFPNMEFDNFVLGRVSYPDWTNVLSDNLLIQSYYLSKDHSIVKIYEKYGVDLPKYILEKIALHELQKYGACEFIRNLNSGIYKEQRINVLMQNIDSEEDKNCLLAFLLQQSSAQ